MMYTVVFNRHISKAYAASPADAAALTMHCVEKSKSFPVSEYDVISVFDPAHNQHNFQIENGKLTAF